MKTFKAFFNYLIVSFSLLFLSLELRAFSIGYYVHQFRLHHISEVTEKKEEQLKDIGKALIKFLKQGHTFLLTPYFNEKEVLHMIDVYHLFKLMYIIQIILLLLIIALSLRALWLHELKPLWKRTGWFLSMNYLILVGGFIVYQLSDFTSLFYQFHEIFFTNDLWLLNPETDLLIQMLPEQFFQQIAFETILLWLIMTILFQVLIFYVGKRLYRRVENILSNTTSSILDLYSSWKNRGNFH